MDNSIRRTNDRFKVVRAAFVVCSLSFFPLAGISAPAPVVDATAQGPAIKDLQNRLKRVETRLDNQGLIELMNRFEQLQQEMQRIIGDLEVQNHQLRTLQKQQKDLYADIDNRLRKLEQSSKTSGVPVSPASGSTVGGVPVTPVPVQSAGSLQGSPQQPVGSNSGAMQQNVPPAEARVPEAMSDVERNVARSAYERAFNLLKQRRYSMAITSFRAFLDTYPNAAYADNAQYWLGEANYANKKYKVALSEFKKVIETYPNSPKRADAMLKIGYTYAELGDRKKALDTLNTIVNAYPGSTAAKLAQKRIRALK